MRSDKDTPKPKIVFDAFAKFNGIYLNEGIHQGQILMRALFDVLLRFWRFQVAEVCNIAKMYDPNRFISSVQAIPQIPMERNKSESCPGCSTGFCVE